MKIINLDLAMRVFQVHGVDANGQVVVRKSLRRSQMLALKRLSCIASTTSKVPALDQSFSKVPDSSYRFGAVLVFCCRKLYM
jgi:hypothetical protein